MVKVPRNRYGLCRPFDVELFAGVLYNALGFPRGSVDELTSKPIPSPYRANEAFRDEFLAREVVRKYPGFNLGVDTREVALKSFLDDEQLNAITNARLMSNCGITSRAQQVIDLAGRKAGSILGAFSVDDFEDGLRFGPGATTSRGHKEATVCSKLQGNNHCTSKAASLWSACLKSRPLWEAELSKGPYKTEIHDSDVLLVVPKNARTGRTIGKGPDANVMMQLALGYCMRKRMYSRGINLQDQSINQRRALAGSLSGHLATVDLKSASNSMTTGLVYRLLGNLPSAVCDPRWYRLADLLRTETVLIEKRVHSYSLFSCMGNGYTFELESLLFYSLAYACCVVFGVEPDVTVYGDDIVCPVEVFPLLKDVFLECGLRINTEKSFFDPTGGFRESCGKCYLNGFDVTAFYVDAEVTTALDVIVLANNITRWSCRPLWRDGRMKVVWEWVVSHLPRRLRSFAGPLTESDSHLIMDFDEASLHLRSCRLPCGTFAGLTSKGLFKTELPTPVSDEIAYLAALYRTSYRRFQAPVSVVTHGTVLIPGRRGSVERGFSGSNQFVQLRVPTVVSEPGAELVSRFVIHEKRVLVNNHWPVLGPWLVGIEDSVRIALLHSSLGVCQGEVEYCLPLND